jgi:hypothetical protein
MNTPRRQFQTTAEVFDALGIDGVMALTGGQKTAVHHYKSCGHFPPKTYVVLRAALAAIGAEAPDSLWQMIEVDQLVLAAVVQRVSSLPDAEVQS